MKATMLGSVLVTLFASQVWSQQAAMHDNHPKISVTGEAAVHVKPDKIAITLGIETWDKDIMLAKQKNSDIVKKAIAAIKACGVPEKEIQTDHLSIEPRWKNDFYKDEFIAYAVRNTLVVTITEPEKVEDLITRTLQAGVNSVHGISFQTTELKTLREKARELALTAAREKAVKMSAVLGQVVGAPIQINEDTPSWYQYSGWDGRSSGNVQVNLQSNRGGTGETSETVALGKMTITARVSVTFELKNELPPSK